MSSLQSQTVQIILYWLPWSLLFFFTIGGITLFFACKSKSDRKEKVILEKNEQLQDQMEKLWRLSNSMRWSHTVEKSLLPVIRAFKEITGAHRTHVYLFDIRQDYLYPVGEKEDLAVLKEPKVVPKSMGVLSTMFNSLQPVFVADVHNHSPELVIIPEMIEDGNLSVICAPIYDEHEIHGMVVNYFDDYVKWNENTADYYKSTCLMIGKFVSNIRVTENYRELAVLQERKYLSQELHDNFSQLISALSIRAEAVNFACDQGNLEKTQYGINQIVATAHEIQSLLRNEMLGLRRMCDEQSDITPLVRDCVDRFSNLSGIHVTLDDRDLYGPVIVPARVGLQFLRILQESLSNIHRHAKATEVSIKLQLCNHNLCMDVIDNGRGFDETTIPENSLGLKISHERANQVGGRISVQSRIGFGTCIHVELPLIPINHG